MRDSADIKRAMSEHADAVWRACLLYLPPCDAEDVFQEAFIKLARRTEPFADVAHERAWLLRVAMNGCKDVLKAARRARRRLAARLAAAACLALALLGGAYVTLTPTAYVGIDVNPSIELAINRFERVVGARGVNEDGADVLQGADVMWAGCADALGVIGEKLEQGGYLDGDAELEVSVTCDDDGQYGLVEAACHERLGDEPVNVSCSRASEEERHAAHECGMGVGKWRAWQDAIEAGEEVSAEDAACMTMRELSDLCSDHEGAGASSEASATSGGHHGEGRHRGDSHG